MFYGVKVTDSEKDCAYALGFQPLAASSDCKDVVLTTVR